MTNLSPGESNGSVWRVAQPQARDVIRSKWLIFYFVFFLLSTEGMINRPRISPVEEFIVATETGILHRLRRENPTKRFFPASELAVCAFMKVTTLPKVLSSLENLEHHITVDPEISAKARTAIERMIAIGGQRPLSPKPETTEDPGE